METLKNYLNNRNWEACYEMIPALSLEKLRFNGAFPPLGQLLPIQDGKNFIQNECVIFGSSYHASYTIKCERVIDNRLSRKVADPKSLKGIDQTLPCAILSLVTAMEQRLQAYYHELIFYKDMLDGKESNIKSYIFSGTQGFITVSQIQNVIGEFFHDISLIRR
jgi:hypothetical protein